MQQQHSPSDTPDPESRQGRGLHCPICSKPMTEQHEEGVTADVCADHGIWLDKGELPAIIARVRRGQQAVTRSVARKAARDADDHRARHHLLSHLLAGLLK